MAALGLVILIVAGVIAGVSGLANSGSDHLVNGFSILGYDTNVSTGRLFIYGAIVGAVGMLGLNMLLAGIGRGFKNRKQTKRELKEARQRNENLEAAMSHEDDARIDLDSESPSGRHYTPRS